MNDAAPPHATAARAILADGGETGALMRAHDWARAPVGPVETWPQPLRTLVAVMLGSRQPMFVAWGAERTLLYNDGYASILGGRHPAALGQPFFEVWSDIRTEVEPIMERGFAGEPTHMDDLTLVMHRHGYPEETHFAFSYTPVRDDSGAVAGVFCACTETTASVMAERALRAERDRARGVLEGMREGFALLDRNFRILEINAEAMRLDRRPRDEVVGRTHWEAYPGTERSALGALYRRALQENAPVSLEHRYTWEDGHDAWIDMRAYPTTEGLAVFFRDITARKAADAALRESEDHHRHTVELNPQVAWTAAPDGQLDHVARRWFEWTGTSGLGETWGEAIHPDDLGPSVEAWTRSVFTGAPYDIEHRVRLRSGEHRWMRSRAYPRRDDGGRIVKWYGATEDIHEGRLAHDLLRESEARFRNVADHAPVMIWTTDPTGSCTYLNRRWYEFTGQGEADALGLGWTKATHPDDQQRAEDAFLAANEAKGPFRIEYRLRRADGTYRWAIDAAAPRYGPSGEFLGYVGSVIDIDERREAEEALRASEARFRAFAEALPIVLFTTHAEGWCDYTNPFFQALTGRSAQELAGWGWVEVLHEDDRARVLAEWGAARSEAHSFEIEYRFRIHDGAYRWFLARSVPVREGDDGAVSRWIGTCVDIQVIVEARDARERQSAELERQVAERTAERDKLWELSEDLLAVANYEGRLLRVSPSWTRLLGHVEETLLTRPYDDIINPDDLGATMDALLAMRSTGRPVSFENRVSAVDHTWRWVAWTVSPEPSGERLIAVGRDVTAQKEASEALARTEEQLRQAQKMEAVGQLTGGIAHDFNNLLTGIVGSLDLMQTRIAQGRTEQVERYARAAMASANRAASLTHRLLAFARRQPLAPKPVNVNALVASMEDLLRRTLGESIAMEIVAAGGLWMTLCDPHQLESAILNLAINARDAMPEGGKLTIETANSHLDNAYAAAQRDVTPGQYVAICITDTGTGMSPDLIARAFDPFFTTKPIGQGTGLGLSMVYGFTKQSEGHIRIYSEVGHGTTVKIYLPRHRGAAQEPVAIATVAEAPRAEAGETVLVVEDEPVVRNLIVEVLQDLGYQALEASDGPAGLRILQSSRRIDLLVTDVGLPGLNGRQMADQAREHRAGLKILFITGYAENATMANGFLEPGMEMITKPFAIETLAKRIREIIART